jgi:hypothetical protein
VDVEGREFCADEDDAGVCQVRGVGSAARLARVRLSLVSYVPTSVARLALQSMYTAAAALPECVSHPPQYHCRQCVSCPSCRLCSVYLEPAIFQR